MNLALPKPKNTRSFLYTDLISIACGPTTLYRKLLAMIDQKPTLLPLRSSAVRLGVGLLVGALALPAQAANLYRYRNAEGGLVIASSIPNDRVPLGYEVIDSNSGRLLRRVAPQLTPAQAAAKAEFERRLKLCERSQRRVRTMYETSDDINAAEAQALESIETRVLNAEANLLHVRNQLSRFEEQAARLERSGTGVSAVLVGNIERANVQIANLEGEIDQRRVEMQRARVEYERDRAIFALGECESAVDSSLFDRQDVAQN